MKKVTIRAFNYKNCKGRYDYAIAIRQPVNWHFEITSGPITFYNAPGFLKSGYKTKSAAISAAKAYRKHLKALKKI